MCGGLSPHLCVCVCGIMHTYVCIDHYLREGGAPELHHYIDSAQGFLLSSLLEVAEIQAQTSNTLNFYGHTLHFINLNTKDAETAVDIFTFINVGHYY